MQFFCGMSLNWDFFFLPQAQTGVVCLGGRPRGSVRAVASGHMLSTCPVPVMLTLLAWMR